MLYLVALLLPPLAVLIAWKPFQFLLNGSIWLIAWVALVAAGPAGIVPWLVSVIHAFVVVGNYYADRRTERIVRAIRERQSSPTDES